MSMHHTAEQWNRLTQLVHALNVEAVRGLRRRK
jgi:hypothetical protein